MPIPLAFLLHFKEDKATVVEISNRLLQDGILTWYDDKDLFPGDDWEREIEEAIENSDFVLIFLSPRIYMKEGYEHKEIRLALKRAERQPAGKRFIIPILTQPFEPPREFRGIQYLPLWEEGAYEKLKAALAFTAP